MKQYDVVVIGAGPGGYVAAIRAAQLGFKTACVERWVNPDNKPVLGGTCLNVGCIPSKALLDSSHLYKTIQKDALQHGITSNNTSINIEKMMQRKNRVVQMLTQGVAGLFQKNQIDWLQGSGKLISSSEIEISSCVNPGQIETVQAKHIIIATGSVPTEIPQATIDQEFIVDSTGALEFDKVPPRLAIIGAGVIGLELGSVWNRLGSEVTILEALPELLTAADKDIATEAQKILRRQGLKFQLGATVTGCEIQDESVVVHYQQNGEDINLTADKLIVAVGRSPNTQGLGADTVGLKLDDSGRIEVSDHYKTSLPNVYAIGDVITGPMLAHKASEEAMAVVEQIAGQKTHLNPLTIPWVIYTWPEIAWVGKTEQQLANQGIEFKSGDFPFTASGRARAMSETMGMVKILADAKTDALLGIHIIGPNASELIAEAVLAMEFDGSAEDIARTIHAHPTLSEAMHEAALAVDDRRIHL